MLAIEGLWFRFDKDIYFSIRLDVFKCRNYKTESRIEARKMWRGLISWCVQSCRWPQRIPGKQQNLQNWVCYNIPSGSRSRFLWGICLKFHLQSWRTQAAVEISNIMILPSEESKGTRTSSALTHKARYISSLKTTRERNISSSSKSSLFKCT